MDLRTPLRMRSFMLDPNHVNLEWFPQQRVAVTKAPRLYVEIKLAEVKPDAIAMVIPVGLGARLGAADLAHGGVDISPAV